MLGCVISRRVLSVLDGAVHACASACNLCQAWAGHEECHMGFSMHLLLRSVAADTYCDIWCLIVSNRQDGNLNTMAANSAIRKGTNPARSGPNRPVVMTG